MRFKVISLGCKANRYDARRLAAYLVANGLEEASNGAPCDIAVVFGCVVTGTAEARSRRAMKQARAARTLVAGCTGRAWSGNGETIEERDAAKITEAMGLKSVNAPPAFLAEDRTRAVVKIQEGCPAACSYCIVPKVRPGSVSRTPKDVLSEVHAAAEAGFPEIVITGVHTGLYGRDLPRIHESDINLANLLRMLLADLGGWKGRLRLSSLEPLEVTDELVEVMASSDGRLAPFIHLPLQSGDDEVLKRMNRPYNVGGYMAIVERLRRAVPRIGVGMDVMVGFPGETEQAFENTLRVMGDAQPVRVHVFAYSERPGTLAASFDDKVPPNEKRERARIAAEKARAVVRRFAETLVGTIVDVIPEGRACKTGYTGEYAGFISDKSFVCRGLQKAVVTAATDAGAFPGATVIAEAVQ